MNVTSRLAIVLVSFAAVLLGGSASVRAQQPKPDAPASAPPPASPPPPYGPPPGYVPPAYNPGLPANVHDGLFLRLHLGVGHTSVSGAGQYRSGVEVAGRSLSLGLALGGALTENLIVFGNLFMSVADRPDSTQYGATSSLDASAFLGGFGLGLAYYIMPANVYLSAALAAMSFSMSDDYGKTLAASNTGLGFQGMIGKEWWVSSEWGLGVAGELVFASMKDRDDNSLTWSATSFSLLFSSTFN